MMAAVWRRDIAQNLGHRTDTMQMLGPRRLDRRVFLEQNADRLVGARSGSFSSEADACSVAEGWVVSFMALVRLAKLHKGEHKASVLELSLGEPEAFELQRDASLEAAVGNLQPHDLGVTFAGGQGTAP